jgi:hypothetical protein
MNDVAQQRPQEVEALSRLVADMDADLGATKPGPSVRPAGVVANPKPLLLKK